MAESSEAKKRVTVKDPKKKIAHQRLSVLQLAKAMGNITEACRRSGMDRTSFYAWKKRYEESGIVGLEDLPPIHHSHPNTTPEEVVRQVLEFSLRHPTWGCTKVSDGLKREGVSVSSPTVQKILIRNEMASRYERLLKLEERHFKEGLELTPEQIALIEKNNPCFAERHVESSTPGELLSQDTKLIGTLSGIGRVYLHAVVDTFGSYGFGFLHINKIPEAAMAVLHNDVLPKYQEWNLPVQAILTDNGREYCGTDAHPYELYLRLNDIEHRTTKVKSPQTNGFAERFMKTVKEEFIVTAFRSNIYESIEALQTDFDAWLKHYNEERPHRGYRNLGNTPWETVQTFLPNLG